MIVVHCVDKTIGFVDAARPKPGQVFAKCFGLADPGDRGTQGVGDEGTDTAQGLSVLGLPIDVVRPSLGRPGS